ncbi:MAG: epoxyqueuosine reductase QueH [Dethiobacter sp.]|nr:epoxyqueuosine reductase QueH [Dethiobacter sp.]MBS3900701.1 epoxyqueuosine reductase QueH [Dethiobacter sp.]MBS3990319.1 epoxyqueuosine reductase QueH [Dethiobacter sp.]
MELLLHMCCGPCSTYSCKRFAELGYNLTGFFYNPNVHPYQEYLRRQEALTQFCAEEKIPLQVSADYQPEKYFKRVIDDLESRCLSCYRLRLEETALKAKELAIPYFATTLAISPFQNHELLCREGEKAGERHGVKFIYTDLRTGFRESVNLSRAMGLYRQSYCGCIFSEKERYCKTSE